MLSEYLVSIRKFCCSKVREGSIYTHFSDPLAEKPSIQTVTCRRDFGNGLARQRSEATSDTQWRVRKHASLGFILTFLLVSMQGSISNVRFGISERKISIFTVCQIRCLHASIGSAFEVSNSLIRLPSCCVL